MRKLDLSRLELVRDSERWGYTRNETASRLGVSLETVRQLVKKGYLKTYYVGRSVRVTSASLAKLKNRLMR